ncbi:TIGR00341 family protein [Saccharobesus litoralis]|uniref:TIGR00341 family protein n=1 Tax=Saccharobesus litoralis TaxID=2172099 RepID=A0A2S0VVF6_9ALTE|nr:TIGR00341 family protein [Saccharobesus litoralis]AWB68188.1 TIGR00341 family protein [Saccharobesus litoralis]
MKYVEVIADQKSLDTVKSISEKVKAKDFRQSQVNEDGSQQMRLLVDDASLQNTLDLLQHVLGAQPSAKIFVMPIEAYLPKSNGVVKTKNRSQSIARESMYQEIEKGAQCDANFFLLVFLSTVVAAIGLLENNVAVVIGAMVIAPLLGPNLALSLGTALGDLELMQKSVKTLVLGISLAFVMSILIAICWPSSIYSHELLSRTDASLDSVALALASGAAATLSLTTGLSGVLVGVMVAVALLPPTVTAGIMLGNGDLKLAGGALLLLAINIVSVNVASKAVFHFKGVRPRTWLEKEKAKQAMRRYLIGWLVTLLALSVIIYFK